MGLCLPSPDGVNSRLLHSIHGNLGDVHHNLGDMLTKQTPPTRLFLDQEARKAAQETFAGEEERRGFLE